MKNWIAFSAFIVMLGVSFGIYYFSVHKVSAMEIPENIVLESIDGDTFIFENAPEKVRFIEFIYTKCPYICPTTTMHMKDLKANLREAGITNEEVEFLVITIDPRRDTKEVLVEYAETFNIDINDGWKILRAEASEIERLTSSFDYYYQDPGNGMITHTSSTYLLDQQNNVVAVYGMGDNGFDKDKIFNRIQKLLNK